ncbi:MAG: hypothetical protein J0I20_04635 [Chloroflexi bacterium]|nr:hypothetical protein [Chloroflexota bacterium]
MESSDVKTVGDFARFVNNLALTTATESQRSMEEYLRALLGLVEQHPQDAPTFTLFAGLLGEAFTAEPAEFDRDWLNYTEPPLDYQSEDETVAIEKIGTGPDAEKENFQFLREMLWYQIADLHLMQERGYFEKSPLMLYMGVTSPTNNSWYNFSTESFLECAVASWDENSQDSTCSWNDLKDLLWFGQNYE